MKARMRGIPARAVLVACLLPIAAATSACGRVPGQFTILNDQVPVAGCSIPVDETVYSGGGLLDLAIVRQGFPSAYLVFPLLQNNLPASTGGTDSNRITLTGFNVDIKPIGAVPPNTADVLANPANRQYLHYQTPWSGSVASGGGKVSAGVFSFPVPLASAILATQDVGLSPTLQFNLRVSALGHTASQDLESDPLDFPISVCARCLVANLQPCPYNGTLANPGNACNPAQDAPVDCCLNGTDLICPGTVAGR